MALPISIAVLATRYLEFCDACCSQAEFCNVKESVRVVVERFGRFDAASFGAPELVDVQSDMIRKGWRPAVATEYHAAMANRVLLFADGGALTAYTPVL